jgi:Flp pilus assembly protein TadD
MQYAKKCISRGKLDEGIVYLKKSLSINIDEAEPFTLLGNIYESRGDTLSAEKYYKIALQLSPGSDEIISNLNRIGRMPK